MDTKIKSKLLGIGELLSEGWVIYRTNVTNILPIILCIYIPIDLVLAFVSQYPQLYNLAIRILEFFIGVIATLSIAIITEKTIEGETIDWKKGLKLALSKWTKAIGTGLLSGVRIFGLTLLLIIPGIIYSLYYSFWGYVVALRNTSGSEALGYSKDLVEGQWWRIFGITFVFGLIAIALALGISYLASLISDNRFFSIVPNILIDVVSSFFTVTYALLFLNNDYVYHYQPEVKIPPMDRL